MPWNTPARGVSDSSVSLDLGTPHTAWRSQHGADLTFGMMASSPEPSPVQFRTPASAMPRVAGMIGGNFEVGAAAIDVSFDENEEADVGMEEIDEEWVGKEWLKGVADLYASTELRGPHNVADLAEFVISALDFHLGACTEGGVLPSAISKTWLLLHILFYDSAGNLRLWPVPPVGSEGAESGSGVSAQSWDDIEKCLRPPTSESAREDGMEVVGGVEFDAGLCHVRRILFWLETSELGDAELDEWLRTFYEGVATCRQSHTSPDITLKGCASELSVVDLSQLIWWHLRRGEMAVAQARCRFGSGDTADRSPGAKQWWRAATLDASRFLFETSQRAVMAGSQYSEWHEEKYKDYKDERLRQAVTSSAQGSAGGISATGWLRQRRLCEMKATQAAQQAAAAASVAGQSTVGDKTRVLSMACDCAIHHALAGGNAAHVLNLGGVHAQRLREILRSVKVLRKWEDELWLDLRRIFTAQIAKLFEGKSREDVLSEVRSSLLRTGDVVRKYETDGVGAEYASLLGEIQRRIMAVDLPGLVQVLKGRAAVHRSEGGMEVLGLCAHLVIFFKVVLYLHRGGTVQRQGVGWQESMTEMLRAGDQVLREYVLDLIARRQWSDIPMLLRIMQNHLVPADDDGAKAFNSILAAVKEENAGFVQDLSVKLLAEVEASEQDADVRREVMVLFEQAMGVEALKRTGAKVAGGLEDRGAQELGVRLQEIFQQTGQWHQAVHHAHHFLRQFVKGGRSGETGPVVSMLLQLVNDTAATDNGGTVLGHADFSEVWRLLDSAGGAEGREEMMRVLMKVKQQKEEADQMLVDFMEVWDEWAAVDMKARRDMLFRKAPGQATPSMYHVMSQCIPGASRGVGGPLDCAERDGLVRAARGYVEGLWEVRQLLSRLERAGGVGQASSGAFGGMGQAQGSQRAGEVREALERLGWMLQQLARLCIWSGVAQAVDDACGGQRVWWDALGSQAPLTQVGRNEVATGRAVLEGGAVQCLYKTLVVLNLRPVWVALDVAEGVVEGDSFRGLMAESVERLLVGEGGYLDVCAQAGSALAHLQGPDVVQEWNSLALGLAGVVADEKTEVYRDLSDQGLEHMVSGPWSHSALSLWC